MMSRKWMIGACVAIAATLGSGVAEAQFAYTNVEVRVNNKSGQKASVSSCCFYCRDCASSTTAVAPRSIETTTYQFDPTEERFFHVKVKGRPTRVLGVKKQDVLRLMEKTGFTSGVHPAVTVVVDKYGNVTFGTVYLKKDAAP